MNKINYFKRAFACVLPSVFFFSIVAHSEVRPLFRSYGDSITAGYRLVKTDRYVEMLSQNLQMDYENLAVSGQTSCQMSYTQVFKENANSSRASLFSTMMAGTNDSNAEGKGPYESVYQKCLTAAVSWLAFPKSDKFSPFSAACEKKGQWLPSVEMPTTGLRSRNALDELNCRIGTAGAPIYVWHDFGDDLNAAFDVKIDGKIVAAVSTHAGIPIKTHDGRGVRGQALLRFPVAAGNHTISFIVRSKNGHYPTIYGIGSLKKPRSQTQLYVGGVPYQLNMIKEANVARYNIIAKRVLQNFMSEGFPLKFVNVRQFWSPSVHEMQDTLHPNRYGSESLSRAFLDAIR